MRIEMLGRAFRIGYTEQVLEQNFGGELGTRNKSLIDRCFMICSAIATEFDYRSQ